MIDKAELRPFPSEEMARKNTRVMSIACFFSGFLLDTFLFGVFLVQLVTYCTSKVQDKLWIRLTVVSVVIMACFHSGFMWWMASNFFVYNFGRYQVFYEPMPFSWLPLLNCVTMSTIQAFFAYRAFLLCNRQFLVPLAVGVCILGSLVSTIIFRVLYGQLISLRDSRLIVPYFIWWLSITMATDAIITASIMYGLIRSKTGLAHTNKLIYRLIRMTLEAQVLVTILAMFLLIDGLVDGKSTLYLSVMLYQSKVNVIGFFFTLNSRGNISKKGTNVTMNDTGPMAFSRTQAATIVVDQETEMHVMHVNPPAVGINRQPHFGSQGDTEVDEDTKSTDSGTPPKYPDPVRTVKYTHAV